MIQSKELKLAIRAAIEAGDYLKKRENIHADSIDGKDIKLSSDKNSEKIIMEILDESGIAILSEEYGLKGQKGDTFWVIDPLDGTMNYYRGLDDIACVSISLWKKGKPVLGVVNRFMSDELFFGEEGFGAYMNDTPICTSEIKVTEQAVMATGFPVKRSYDTDNLTQFVQQVQSFKKVRMLGAAALMSTFVACGRVDAYFEDEIMVWDVSAGVAIVNAAGGTAVLEPLDDNKCICKCFANQDLKENYYAKGL